MSYSVSWSAAEVNAKSGSRPPGRFANACTRYGSSGIIFHGGCTWVKGRRFSFLDDMWVLKIVMPGEISWELLSQRGQTPGPRAYHHLCSISRNLYLFGGKKSMEDRRAIPGMHVYDNSTQCWYQQHVDGTNHPFALGCSASVIDDQIFTFGGMLDGKVHATTHLFDPQTSSWSKLYTSGTNPPARCDHGACTVKSSIFVHGGCAAADVYLCDLYELDTNTLLWTRLEFGGLNNIPRAGHTLTAHHGKDLYVFGGFNDQIYPDGGPVTEDLCKYSLGQKRWKTPQAFPTDYEAIITYNHSAVIIQSCLYVIGGLALEGMANDVQIAQLISPSARKSAPKEVRLKSLGPISKSRDFVDKLPGRRVVPLKLHEVPDIERRSNTSSHSFESAEICSSRPSLDPFISEVCIQPSATTAQRAAHTEDGEHQRVTSSSPFVLSRGDDEISGGDERRMKSPPIFTREDSEDGDQRRMKSPPIFTREDSEDGRGSQKMKSPPPIFSREDSEEEGGSQKMKSPPPIFSREDSEDGRGSQKMKSPPHIISREDSEDGRGSQKMKSPSPTISGRQAPEPPDTSDVDEEEKKVEEIQEQNVRTALHNLNAYVDNRRVRKEEEDTTTSDNDTSSGETSSGSESDSSSGVEAGEEGDNKEDEFSFSLSTRPEPVKPDEDGRASDDVYEELEAQVETDNGNDDEDSEETEDEQTLTTAEQQQLEQLSAQVSSK